jgi:uncharacterized protein with HEPN domain
MPHDPLTLLHDILEEARFICDETAGKTLSQYENERALRRAVERSFIIVGEAMSRLARIGAALVQALGNYPQIIGFRNVVVHGYDVLEDAIVWGIIQNEIPRLISSTQEAIHKMKPKSKEG